MNCCGVPSGVDGGACEVAEERGEDCCDEQRLHVPREPAGVGVDGEQRDRDGHARVPERRRRVLVVGNRVASRGSSVVVVWFVRRAPELLSGSSA